MRDFTISLGVSKICVDGLLLLGGGESILTFSWILTKKTTEVEFLGSLPADTVVKIHFFREKDDFTKIPVTVLAPSL